MLTDDESRPLRAIRFWLGWFIVGLILSGVTAFPLVHEAAFVVRVSHHSDIDHNFPALYAWLDRVAEALADNAGRYPFLAYGTDWLAFGHLVIATFFIPAYCNPIRNKAVIDCGLVACAGVLLLALIAGPVRGIPIYWRLIDSSFGIAGCWPLMMARRHIRALESSDAADSTHPLR